jgi:hypothetical protein
MRPVTLILLHMPPCYGASLTRYYGSPDLFRTHLALASGGGGGGGANHKTQKKTGFFPIHDCYCPMHYMEPHSFSITDLELVVPSAEFRKRITDFHTSKHIHSFQK